jgi:hypothetical protein
MHKLHKYITMHGPQILKKKTSIILVWYFEKWEALNSATS